MQAKARPGSYIPGLDGLRAVAFFIVFLAHSAFFGKDSLFVPATFGVTIFFFLSGYLITTLLRREFERTGTVSLRDFYIRRTLRIFAPLYVAYGLAVLAAWLLGMEHGNGKGLASSLLYFYNYSSDLHWGEIVPHGMDVIWSLCVEEHFYLLFPLGLLMMARRRWSWRKQANLLFWICLATLVWRYFITWYMTPIWEWAYRATDSRFDSILWGCILALRFNPQYDDPPLLPKKHRTAAFLLAVFGIVLTLLPKSIWYRDTLRYTLQSALLMPVFAFVLTTIESPLVKWLEWKPVRYLGWISYSLYLCHFVIVEDLRSRFSRAWWVPTCALVLALVYAVVMRYVLELPLQNLRARFRHVAEGDESKARVK